jgi:sarcosine oxidase subunit delta
MAFLITCPLCGPRDAYEFRFGGEDKGPRPDQESLSPEAWCDYVHMADSRFGIQKEWWYHRKGCGTWFTICRDTVRNIEVFSKDLEAGQ